MSNLSKEEILLRNGFEILENGCCYTDMHRIDRVMNEYAKQESRNEVEGYEIWKKQQGVMWNIRNATTPANELYDLYLQSKQKQG